MPQKYSDIIALRSGRAAYNINEEVADEWQSFIPNAQFNGVLRRVISSVRANDIDMHKSFWIEGTYGSGKSHAAAVISHLLSDPVENISDWLSYGYHSSDSTEALRQLHDDILAVRQTKRLLTVKLYGEMTLTHAADLAIVLQRAVTTTLRSQGIELTVPTDFETYIDHINKAPQMWDTWIADDMQLSTLVADSKHLVKKLADSDVGILSAVREMLRQKGFDLRLQADNVVQWLSDVEQQLREKSVYSGLLIMWDEFTDVLSSAVGESVLKQLQQIAERFATIDPTDPQRGSYLLYVSHPSAFNKISREMSKQTDGRYHRMHYNMESVSAFKIMSSKFRIINLEAYDQARQDFFNNHEDLLTVFTQNSNDQKQTAQDLRNLYPLHPGTANLATHYATVIGSSSRSVFEFLGQNDAIKAFLDSEEAYANGDVISADYLWDYVLKALRSDPMKFNAVTERYSSCEHTVKAAGAAHFAIFKGILLLNAFNNVSGNNNQGLITPSEENIRQLFVGTCHEDEVDDVLQWLNDKSVIQRSPTGLYSVQFSALPAGEIEKKKDEMRMVQYAKMSQVWNIGGDTINSKADHNFFTTLHRQHAFKCFADEGSDSLLRSKIKNERRQVKPNRYFFALLLARNAEEKASLEGFAERWARDTMDFELGKTVLLLFDETFGDNNYDRFIEYLANSACASEHQFIEQATVQRNEAIAIVKEWLDRMHRGNVALFINGEKKISLNASHLSSTVNSSIAKIIYPYAAEAYDLLRQNAKSHTFWKPQVSKEIARIILMATTLDELDKLSKQMKPLKYLLQDCLDNNLNFKADTPENHPLKRVNDKVKTIINHADKSSVFNFDDKFRQLTEPPYGISANIASMVAMAFALRPWIDKIFDTNGKPRKANELADDLQTLFKVWEDDKSNSKLNFKLQTTEEGKLCKTLVFLFNLGKQAEITSLKEARYRLVSDYLQRHNAPLWVLKYADKAAAANQVTITDRMRRLIDNISTICRETDLRNPALVTDTIALADEIRLDFRNLLNTKEVFSLGFNAYLLQLPKINVQKRELDSLYEYLMANLSGSVGYWTEAEVHDKAKDWRLECDTPTLPEPPAPPIPPVQPTPPTPPTPVIRWKRRKALERVNSITTLQDAKALLAKLCQHDNEWLLDFINKQ